MIKIITLIFFIASAGFAKGQTNYQKFKDLFKKNDTVKLKSFLAEWEAKNSNDPELYTSAINYYFSDSKREAISVDTEQKSKESFQFTDSTGKVAGFINSISGFNTDKVNKAIQYANAGIEKFPNRLDIRFGKCYILQEIKDYNNFTKEIIKTIEYSIVNNNNWLWTENEKQENGQAFMLETIQSYLKHLYDTEDDNLLPNMIQIGETAIKYYSTNVEILSSTSVALMLTEKYDKAIDYLKQAEKLNPKDFIVLNNIAQAYKVKGDKQNSIRYYKLTEKYGDDRAKEQARDNIKALEK